MKYPEINTNNPVYQDGVYRVEEIKAGVYAIDTTFFESMYLLLGEKRAILIDSGMRDQELMPVLRKITSLPISLVLTHGHSDHMYRSHEFDEVYLSEVDIRAWSRGLGFMAAISSPSFFKFYKRMRYKKYKPMKEGTIFELGRRSLRVVYAKGHTPGSVFLIDEEDELIFSGDAIGSGSYAWMWMPFCSVASEYRESLLKLKEKIKPYKDYEFLGGHRMQSFKGEDFVNGHKLSYQVIIDMISLCEKILDGSLKESDTYKEFGVKVRLYEYGDAAVVYRDKKLR